MKVSRQWSDIKKHLSACRIAKFRKMVDVRGPNECWPWKGYVSTTSGYGSWSGWGEGPITAHRIAYGLANNGIPRDLFVLHECDNPPCCNPAHLKVGTHTQNMRDAKRKGRMGWQNIGTCECGNPKIKSSRRCPACQDVRNAEVVRRNAAALRQRNYVRRVVEIRSRSGYHFPDTREALLAAMDGDDRRTLVLERYYGLYGRKHEWLADIARDMGVSRERIRQLRNGALGRLKFGNAHWGDAYSNRDAEIAA